MRIPLLLLAAVAPGLALADCYDFFHVRRPVAAGAVIHEYIAAERSDHEVVVFGMPKGDEDRAQFAKFRARKSNTRLRAELLGSACDDRAQRALTIAKERSDAWKKSYASWGPYLARMVATPALGKPCARSAQDIRKHLAPLLK